MSSELVGGGFLCGWVTGCLGDWLARGGKAGWDAGWRMALEEISVQQAIRSLGICPPVRRSLKKE